MKLETILKGITLILIGVSIGLMITKRLTKERAEAVEFDKKYIRALQDYSNTLENAYWESHENLKELLGVVDYYKEAYKDTINQHIQLMKIMNRRG